VFASVKVLLADKSPPPDNPVPAVIVVVLSAFKTSPESTAALTKAVVAT
jgi:hypothetical protein